MNPGCNAKSLQGRTCILPANHETHHRASDGRTWPDGQAWQDVIDTYFKNLGS